MQTRLKDFIPGNAQKDLKWKNKVDVVLGGRSALLVLV